MPHCLPGSGHATPSRVCLIGMWIEGGRTEGRGRGRSRLLLLPHALMRGGRRDCPLLIAFVMTPVPILLLLPMPDTLHLIRAILPHPPSRDTLHPIRATRPLHPIRATRPIRGTLHPIRATHPLLPTRVTRPLLHLTLATRPLTLATRPLMLVIPRQMLVGTRLMIGTLLLLETTATRPLTPAILLPMPATRPEMTGTPLTAATRHRQMHEGIPGTETSPCVCVCARK